MRNRLILAALVLFAACTDDNNVTNPGNVTLSIAEDSVIVDVGQTRTLTPAVNGSTQKPTFTSTNTAIATVDTAGVITGRGIGSAYVVAALAGARDSVKVSVAGSLCSVSGPAASVVEVPTTSLSASRLSMVGAFATNAASVNAPPAQLPLLGSGSVRERYTAEVAAAGQVAYTTTWSSRAGVRGNALKIWDVSGNTPVLADSIVIAGAGTVSDVQISDDGALLAISLEVSNPQTVNGIELYDRSNPTKPTLIRHFACASTRGGVHTLKLGRVNNRHYAFLAVNFPAQLVVVDITNPRVPEEILVRPMGNPFIHDTFVRDGVLFTALWNNGMTIWDIGGAGRGGTPANPVQLGTVKTAPCPGCGAGTSSVHNIWWFNDPRTGSKKYAFIGEEGPASLFTYAKGDIHVVDVSDFNNPREVAFFRPDSTTASTGTQPMGTHNFDVDEPSGILYAAYYNGGVRALDIRGDLSTCDPTAKDVDGRCNLRLMGRDAGVALTAAPSFIWGVKIVGNRLYASDMPNGIHKVDISALKR